MAATAGWLRLPAAAAGCDCRLGCNCAGGRCVQELARCTSELEESEQQRALAELRQEERCCELGDQVATLQALVERLGTMLNAKQVGAGSGPGQARHSLICPMRSGTACLLRRRPHM
jgi:hypothetical protein